MKPEDRGVKFPKIVFGIALGLVVIGLWIFQGQVKNPAPSQFVRVPPAASSQKLESQDGSSSLSILPQAPPAEDPLEEMKRIMAEWDVAAASQDGEARTRVLAELKAWLETIDPDQLARELPEKLLDQPCGMAFLTWWGNKDRKSALDWMATRPNPDRFQMGALVQGWATEDPDGLQQYVNGLPAGPWKETVLASASQDALENQNPQDAIVLLRQMQPSDQEADLLTWAASSWAKQDPQAASSWVAQVSDPELQQKLIGAIAIGYSNGTDPATALTWLIQSLPAGDALNSGVEKITETWATSDPNAVAVWLQQFPEGELRQTVLENLLDTWIPRNQTAAVNWINSLPENSLKTEAVKLLNRP